MAPRLFEKRKMAPRASHVHKYTLINAYITLINVIT